MAKRIFHFSDFHINPSCGQPEDNVLFNGICQHIQTIYGNEPDDCNYIVYTGDIVDANPQPNETASQYTKRITDSYNLAHSYFVYLMTILGVNCERIIFCPGNHDKTRINDLVNNELCNNEVCKSNTVALDKLIPNYNLYSEAYKRYVNFVKVMCGRTQDFKTTFYSVDGLNFLIMNSTWKDKDAEYKNKESGFAKTYRRCVDCKGVLEVLHEHSKELSDDVNNNILLVHDPSLNWCEKSILSYSKSINNFIHDNLEQYFGFMLCGDVHTESEIDNFNCISTKLSGEDKASYGCIDYSGSAPKYRKHIANPSGSVSLKITTKEKNDLVKLSMLTDKSYYIKKLALRFLYGNEKRVSTPSIILASTDFDSKNERWDKLSAFFELFSSYRKSDDNGKSVRVPIDCNLFAFLANEIKNNNGKICLSVKSKPAQGKSTFLSLLYIYLLGLFSNGSFPYIPVYFNRENLTDKKYQEKLSIFMEFMHKADELSKELKCPVCFFLDGFNQYNYYEHSFDDEVYKNYLEQNKCDLSPNHKYIISIDTDKNRSIAPTLIGENRDAPGVLYFRDIETTSLKEQTAKDFLAKLTDIMQKDNSEKMADNILSSGIEYVDMNLVVRHGDAFVNSNNLVDIFSSYGRKKGIFNQEQPKNIPKCAYTVLYKHSKYNCLPAPIKVTHSAYCTLLRQREVGMYYCALYYFSELRRLSSSKNRKEKIKPDSVLNRFFSHEQNIYLKILRDRAGVTSQELSEFLKNHFNDLQHLGKAQFIYLFAKIEDSFGEMIIHSKDLKLKFAKTSPKSTDEENFRAEIMNRTKRVIEAFDNHEKMKEYILSLLRDQKTRRINRATHMFYYSDVSFNNAIKICKKNTIFYGFDIYHTFLTLSSRIKKHSGNDNLKLLDVVTLCDLMEHRFRQPVAISYNSDDECASFFYTETYNNSNDVSPKKILNEFINTIECFDVNKINSKIISLYIKKCLQDARNVLCLLESGEKCIPRDMFHQANAYEKIKRVETEERKGWKINTAVTNSKSLENRKILSKEPALETVEQHMYQCYLMGLLYLPVDFPDKDELKNYKGEYNKQKILNTLLIHDIGESEIGDWPAFYSFYAEKKEAEDNFNKQLFIGGAYSETSDLTEYLELWNSWKEEKNSNINAIIAKELDRIQFLYKYYELLNEGKLTCFSNARKKQISDVRKLIKTSVGKKILNILVDDNPYLKTAKKS